MGPVFMYILNISLFPTSAQALQYRSGNEREGPGLSCGGEGGVSKYSD